MSLSVQIGKFNKNTQKKIHKVRRGVIIKVLGAVIMDTPVLTGRLRGNWQLTEGKPADGELNVEDKAGTATVAKMVDGVLVSDGDTPLFLTNNLPYGPRIEFDGWSHTKAPLGMVRRNVARFNTLIKIENDAQK